jgi:hypothetical protein
MWINLYPFIQEAYQGRLTLGTITSTQGGYAQSNCFAGLATNKDSDNDTADTIARTINLHIAYLTAQTMATLNKQAMQTNASLQQLASNNAQLHLQQQAIINQMAMMSFGSAYQGAAAGVAPQQTTPTTDLPTPSITPPSTRVLDYAPAIRRAWTHGGTKRWTQLRQTWTRARSRQPTSAHTICRRGTVSPVRPRSGAARTTHLLQYVYKQN